MEEATASVAELGRKPVETGKEYDVQITETSRQGDGIAKVQGFVIFVKNAKVGQSVKIKITNVGARFATLKWGSSRSTTRSATRTTPLTKQQPK